MTEKQKEIARSAVHFTRKGGEDRYEWRTNPMTLQRLNYEITINGKKVSDEDDVDIELSFMPYTSMVVCRVGDEYYETSQNDSVSTLRFCFYSEALDAAKLAIFDSEFPEARACMFEDRKNELTRTFLVYELYMFIKGS